MSECADQGIVTQAVAVDHAIPHRGDQQLFRDLEGNGQSLCRRCHAKKSAAGL